MFVRWLLFYDQTRKWKKLRFCRDAFKKAAKRHFRFKPFRVTAENMARYKDDDNFAFWQNIENYKHFEIAKNNTSSHMR